MKIEALDKVSDKYNVSRANYNRTIVSYKQVLIAIEPEHDTSSSQIVETTTTEGETTTEAISTQESTIPKPIGTTYLFFESIILGVFLLVYKKKK